MSAVTNTAEIRANIRVPPSARAAIPGVQSKYDGRVQERRFKPTTIGLTGEATQNFVYGRTRRIDLIKLNRAANDAAQYPLPEWMDVDHDEL